MMIDLMHVLDVAAHVVAGASVVATVTPTKKDDTILGWLSSLIHALALNFSQVKGKEPGGAS